MSLPYINLGPFLFLSSGSLTYKDQPIRSCCRPDNTTSSYRYYSRQLIRVPFIHPQSTLKTTTRTTRMDLHHSPGYPHITISLMSIPKTACVSLVGRAFHYYKRIPYNVWLIDVGPECIKRYRTKTVVAAPTLPPQLFGSSIQVLIIIISSSQFQQPFLCFLRPRGSCIPHITQSCCPCNNATACSDVGIHSWDVSL